MTDRELMKWALYALEGSNAYDWPVVEELKERLAQPEQDPVAWLKTWSDGSVSVLKTKSHAFADHELEPLYAAPPKQWVGLTDEEIQDLSYLSQKIDEGNAAWFDRWGFARAIEAKLKEKNKW